MRFFSAALWRFAVWRACRHLTLSAAWAKRANRFERAANAAPNKRKEQPEEAA